YLIWMGITLLRTRNEIALAKASQLPQALRRVFAQGFLTNALNPKVALFFLALLPQFIDPNAPHKALAFVFLGIVFTINGTLWNLLVAGTAAWVTRSVRQTHAITTWLNRTIGAVFVYLGVRLVGTQ